MGGAFEMVRTCMILYILDKLLVFYQLAFVVKGFSHIREEISETRKDVLDMRHDMAMGFAKLESNISFEQTTKRLEG